MPKQLIITFSLLLLTSFTHAQQQNKVIDVIAIEYPPFTTAYQVTNGIAFEYLNKASQNANITWQANFLPPARAYKRIESGNWCASFYPVYGESQFSKVDLSSEIVKIGLIRKKQPEVFSWHSLQELQPNSIALLRTGNDSTFANQFKAESFKIAFVDSIDSAVQMVLLSRVNYAMLDNVSFENLDKESKNKLQFSHNSLIETKISIFLNDKCQIPSLSNN